MGQVEKWASIKQHENRPINISSARCKIPSIKGNIDKMIFYWNPEPSIKVTLSINAFRTAKAKPHICAQLAVGMLTMIGIQNGTRFLKQISNKREKETEDLENHVWDSLFNDVAGPHLVIQNMQMKTTHICPHPTDNHSWKSLLFCFPFLGTNKNT